MAVTEREGDRQRAGKREREGESELLSVRGKDARDAACHGSKTWISSVFRYNHGLVKDGDVPSLPDPEFRPSQGCAFCDR